MAGADLFAQCSMLGKHVIYGWPLTGAGGDDPSIHRFQFGAGILRRQKFGYCSVAMQRDHGVRREPPER